MHLIHSLFQFISPLSLSLSFLFYLPLLFSFSHAHPILAKQKTMRIRLNTESTKREKYSGRAVLHTGGWVEARNNALFNRNNPFLRQRNETVEGWVSLSGGMLGRFNTRENLAAGGHRRRTPCVLFLRASTNTRPCCCAGNTNTRDCHSR